MTDRQTELRWLRRAKAVTAFARKSMAKHGILAKITAFDENHGFRDFLLSLHINQPST